MFNKLNFIFYSFLIVGEIIKIVKIKFKIFLFVKMFEQQIRT